MLYILSVSDIANLSDANNAPNLSDKNIDLIESLEQELRIYERGVC